MTNQEAILFAEMLNAACPLNFPSREFTLWADLLSASREYMVATVKDFKRADWDEVAYGNFSNEWNRREEGKKLENSTEASSQGSG